MMPCIHAYMQNLGGSFQLGWTFSIKLASGPFSKIVDLLLERGGFFHTYRTPLATGLHAWLTHSAMQFMMCHAECAHSIFGDLVT